MPFPRQSLTAPLTLADEGVFTIGGRRLTTDHPGASPTTGSPGRGAIPVDQMYVHYRVPVDADKPPIVMVHGSNGSGSLWETTPDGREGWSTWFVRQGHPVFVVDHAGRGRSGFDPSRINAGTEAHNIFLGTYQRQWVNGRMGPVYPTPFPGVRFPIEAFDRFMELHVPNSETTLERGGQTTPGCLAALLDEIGPAILIVHSQGGLYGIEAVRRRHGLVLALVSVEGGSESLTAEDAAECFTQVPFLSLWGDNSHGAELTNGDFRREGCRRAVDLINEAGGTAELMMLPEQGIPGNSHYLMMDTNSLEVATIIEGWIGHYV
jgi:pimeloyl-ACP methyl ester carboxylesterase